MINVNWHNENQQVQYQYETLVGKGICVVCLCSLPVPELNLYTPQDVEFFQRHRPYMHFFAWDRQGELGKVGSVKKNEKMKKTKIVLHFLWWKKCKCACCLKEVFLHTFTRDSSWYCWSVNAIGYYNKCLSFIGIIQMCIEIGKQIINASLKKKKYIPQVGSCFCPSILL